jgi:amino acid transporter
MAIESLCPPALIYLVFSITQILIDTSHGLYNTALMKFLVAILFTTLLNYLCTQGLGTISWIIVFIPFILMTLIIALLLLMFGMDPKSGKLNLISKDTTPPKQPDARKDAIQKQISNTSTKLPANTSVTPITSTVHDIYYDNQTNKIVDVALQQ